MRDNREKSRPDNTDVQRSISVISAVPEEILSSLLQTENDLAAEYRRRNDPYNYRSVHPADVDDLLSRGWEVQRRAKRGSGFDKKSHTIGFSMIVCVPYSAVCAIPKS